MLTRAVETYLARRRAAGFESPEAMNAREARRPIHRVEIETRRKWYRHSASADLLRGFTAGDAAAPEAGLGAKLESFEQQPSPFFAGASVGERDGMPSSPETHVFSDLVDFLRREFEKDCGKVGHSSRAAVAVMQGKAIRNQILEFQASGVSPARW
jgi:hypothetical protein